MPVDPVFVHVRQTQRAQILQHPLQVLVPREHAGHLQGEIVRPIAAFEVIDLRLDERGKGPGLLGRDALDHRPEPGTCARSRLGVMRRQTVVVLGGYGAFGSRIVRSLARHRELELVIAGRSRAAASQLAAELAGATHDAPPRAVAIDVADVGQWPALFDERPAVVVDTAGPFQGRDYALAQRCVEAGVHYIDIADGRRYVAGIAALDAAARARDVLVASGASTVPAITTALVTDLVEAGAAVVEIDVGISPGHRSPRGLATVRAILDSCGHAIPSLSGRTHARGWGGLGRHRYPPPVGVRWLSNVDTPERALWRDRYPALARGSVRAGLEIGFLHVGLWLCALAVRAGLLRSLAPQAARFIRIADACDRFGSDTGAMHVRVATRDEDGRRSTRQATLVAERGDGPQIPATPAALLVKKLLSIPGYAPVTVRGARACVDLLTMPEILGELKGFGIRYLVDRADVAAVQQTSRKNATC